MSNHRAQVEEILKKHNPNALGSIDVMMGKYAGKEGDLVKALQVKYKIPASPGAGGGKSPAGKKSPGAPGSGKKSPAPGGKSPSKKIPAGAPGTGKKAPSPSPAKKATSPSPGPSKKAPGAPGTGKKAPPAGGASPGKKSPSPASPKKLAPAPGTPKGKKAPGSPSAAGKSPAKSPVGKKSPGPAPGAKSPAPPAAGKAPDMSLKPIMIKFYQKYAPQKVSTVDKILETFAGKEEVMFDHCESQYKCPGFFAEAREQVKARNASVGAAPAASPATTPAGKKSPSPAAAKKSPGAPGSGKKSPAAATGKKSPAPPAAGGPTAAGTPTADLSLKPVMTKFYQKYAPQKVSTIDAILQTFAGREEVMFDHCENQYKCPGFFAEARKQVQAKKATGVAAATPAAPAAAAPKKLPLKSAATPPAPAPPQEGGAAAADMSLQPVMVKFYQKYAPQKVATVPAILQTFAGREEVMFDHCENQYKCPGFFAEARKQVQAKKVRTAVPQAIEVPPIVEAEEEEAAVVPGESPPYSSDTALEPATVEEEIPSAVVGSGGARNSSPPPPQITGAAPSAIPPSPSTMLGGPTADSGAGIASPFVSGQQAADLAEVRKRDLEEIDRLKRELERHDVENQKMRAELNEQFKINEQLRKPGLASSVAMDHLPPATSGNTQMFPTEREKHQQMQIDHLQSYVSKLQKNIEAGGGRVSPPPHQAVATPSFTSLDNLPPPLVEIDVDVPWKANVVKFADFYGIHRLAVQRLLKHYGDNEPMIMLELLTMVFPDGVSNILDHEDQLVAFNARRLAHFFSFHNPARLDKLGEIVGKTYEGKTSNALGDVLLKYYKQLFENVSMKETPPHVVKSELFRQVAHDWGSERPLYSVEDSARSVAGGTAALGMMANGFGVPGQQGPTAEVAATKPLLHSVEINTEVWPPLGRDVQTMTENFEPLKISAEVETEPENYFRYGPAYSRESSRPVTTSYNELRRNRQRQLYEDSSPHPFDVPGSLRGTAPSSSAGAGSSQQQYQVSPTPGIPESNLLFGLGPHRGDMQQQQQQGDALSPFNDSPQRSMYNASRGGEELSHRCSRCTQFEEQLNAAKQKLYLLRSQQQQKDRYEQFAGINQQKLAAQGLGFNSTCNSCVELKREVRSLTDRLHNLRMNRHVNPLVGVPEAPPPVPRGLQRRFTKEEEEQMLLDSL